MCRLQNLLSYVFLLTSSHFCVIGDLINFRHKMAIFTGFWFSEPRSRELHDHPKNWPT